MFSLMKKSVGFILQKHILALCLLVFLLAGQDTTDTFFGLHRCEVLEKPNYARLQIGVIGGETPEIKSRAGYEISKIPYGEPVWLTPGYYSPYYNEVFTCLFVFQKLPYPAVGPPKSSGIHAQIYSRCRL